MNITNKTVLITGANRGIGRALVNEALRRGAKRVYAGTRSELQNADKRVTRLTLDVTNGSQIQRAAKEVDTLDVLINNAGIALYDDLSDPGVIEQHLAVHLFGSFNVTRAFLPLLRRSKGAVVNILSLAALAPLPVIPAYSVSKAAAFSMTQSLRAFLAGQGVRVHAVFPGPIDTDMTRGFEIPKASAESAALGIFDGLEKGEEDIFPDPASQSIAEGWRTGVVKAFERQYAAFVPESAANL
jgi:NAD(P)-dependent dehydrogenase (short-subunit alcohol dehydrogenase family)